MCLVSLCVEQRRDIEMQRWVATGDQEIFLQRVSKAEAVLSFNREVYFVPSREDER